MYFFATSTPRQGSAWNTSSVVLICDENEDNSIGNSPVWYFEKKHHAYPFLDLLACFQDGGLNFNTWEFLAQGFIQHMAFKPYRAFPIAGSPAGSMKHEISNQPIILFNSVFLGPSWNPETHGCFPGPASKASPQNVDHPSWVGCKTYSRWTFWAAIVCEEM